MAHSLEPIFFPNHMHYHLQAWVGSICNFKILDVLMTSHISSRTENQNSPPSEF